jgi:hypothetical protein
VASAGYEHARLHHTYDHRVDQLVDVLRGTEPRSPADAPADRSALAATIDADVEVQRLAVFGDPGLAAELPTREVWEGTDVLDRLAPGTMEAIVIGVAGSAHLDRALRAARRYVYATADHGEVRSRLGALHPAATFAVHAGVLRADLGAESYRANVSEWTAVRP